MLVPATALLFLTLSPQRIHLDRSTLLDGIPCAAGVAWTVDGKLEQCTLSTGATVAGAVLPAGSTVHLEPDGALRFVFLPADTEVQGHLCRGHGHDWMTTFHTDGHLKLCWLARPETIDGVPCGQATIWAELFGGGAGTTFHPDGSLASCKLAADATVGGRAYEKGDRVDLAP